MRARQRSKRIWQKHQQITNNKYKYKLSLDWESGWGTANLWIGGRKASRANEHTLAPISNDNSYNENMVVQCVWKLCGHICINLISCFATFYTNINTRTLLGLSNSQEYGETSTTNNSNSTKTSLESLQSMSNFTCANNTEPSMNGFQVIQCRLVPQHLSIWEKTPQTHWTKITVIGN